MKLSEFKQNLQQMEGLSFQLPDGKKVPAHFHVTELGKSTKHFIDCGGTERMESKATIQLWTSIDLHHRLKAPRLVQIIDMGQRLFNEEDPEMEVEYQMDTIARFGLEIGNGTFQLTTLETDCLAKEQCGVPLEKVKLAISSAAESCCSPGGGCC